MGRPQSTLIASDGNMGLIPASPAATVVKLGHCSQGPLNTLVFPASKSALVDIFGVGATVDCAGLAMDYPGRGQVGVVRCAASNAGTAGSVTKTDNPNAAGTPTTIGANNARLTLVSNQQNVRIKVVVSGNSTALSVPDPVSGLITVNSATDGGGAATSTGSDILAAVQAKATVMALLASAGLHSASNGSGVMGAIAETALPFGSTGAVSVSGAPLDAYQVRVKITRSGALNVGAFRYSLDGGDLYSDEITIPNGGDYVIPWTGLSLTFTPGAGTPPYVKDDQFSFDCVAPSPSNADIQAALDALRQDYRSVGIIHIIGAIDTTIFAGLGAAADAFEAARKYVLIVAEVAGPAANQSNTAWATALLGTWGATSHKRVALAAGMAEVTATVGAPMAGRTMKRNAAWVLTARAGSRPISEDVGRVATGPLPGVVKIYQDDVADTLLDARFSCLYTVPDYEGFYGGGRIFSQSGSDFRDWQDLRVLNEAMRIGYRGQTRYLSDTVRPRLVAADGFPAGSIDPGDALAIEDYLNALLAQGLGLAPGTSPQLAASARAIVDRYHVLTQDQQLLVTYEVATLVTLKTITGVAGLRNVALNL